MLGVPKLARLNLFRGVGPPCTCDDCGRHRSVKQCRARPMWRRFPTSLICLVLPLFCCLLVTMGCCFCVVVRAFSVRSPARPAQDSAVSNGLHPKPSMPVCHSVETPRMMTDRNRILLLHGRMPSQTAYPETGRDAGECCRVARAVACSQGPSSDCRAEVADSRKPGRGRHTQGPHWQ